MTISTIDIGRRIYSNITGGKAIIVLPLFFYRNQKGADKIEYSKPSLVAMAHARTIATFFVMGFSLLSASEFLPTEKWRCAKQ